MVLDNDTRGWIMTAVSGIGMFDGCEELQPHLLLLAENEANADTACTFGGEVISVFNPLLPRSLVQL
ncbi:hypothetical protein ACJQWK_00137 [Exserohilum turcicum]